MFLGCVFIVLSSGCFMVVFIGLYLGFEFASVLVVKG